jgi:hypothetical protein
MSSFTPSAAAPSVAAVDPTKHVNYTLGMILGVDDFTQEFAYLAGRDQWLARDLIGYGTVSGLRVTTVTDQRGPQAVVAAGVALGPRGQLIRVPSAQCASLNDWLANNQGLLLEQAVSPVNRVVSLYVVLRYRDCLTDQVPIPGEPCRTEEESMAASRAADCFQLSLETTPPAHADQRSYRAFAAWLNQLQLSDAAAGLPTLDEFIQAARHALDPLSSPLASPLASPVASPLSGAIPPLIPAARAREYYQAALRVWVTELRPLALAPGDSQGLPPAEDGLLLAELQVPLTGNPPRVSSQSPAVVKEERRPYVLPLRMIQEWFLGSRAGPDYQSPLAFSRVGGSSVIAAGKFAADGTAAFSFGGLKATLVKTGPVFLLTFPAFRAGANYSVKGTPVALLSNTKIVQTFELVADTDPGLPALLQQTPFSPQSGLFVRVMQSTGDPVKTGFTVEISQF